MNLKYLVSLFLVVSTINSINGGCPEKCICDKKLDHENIFVINCSNHGNMSEILELPTIEDLNFDEIELNIQGNNFTSLPNNLILGYDKVTLINASHNNIHKMFLQNIPANLKVLDVTKNNLSVITTDIQELLKKNEIKTYVNGNPWIYFCSILDFKKSNHDVEPLTDHELECKTEILIEKNTLAKNIHICNVIIILMICTVVIVLGIFMIYQFYSKFTEQS
ncbi:unnamed protein product [Diamesa serratosioi]